MQTISRIGDLINASMTALRTENRIPELLAPAGSYDAARAAVNAGADAIYMGGPLFSARAYAESSGDNDMLLQSIEYCHLRGVKVYMTLNTLMKEREMQVLPAYFRPYAEAGVDGVIVQDPGVMRMIREQWPEMHLHISTQAAVTGPLYAKRLRDLGASRVVLARELSLQEIRAIHEETEMEIEVFAHGALCYAFSGQCLMSSMIGGRSGNRGRCAGTCRLPFALLDGSGRQISRGKEPYLLSMKDLKTACRLREMLDAGVCSFKIEGRMKSPVYVAAVTSVYRKYLDLAVLEGQQDRAERGSAGGRPSVITARDSRILEEGFARGGMTDGYLDGHKGAGMITLEEKPELRVHDEQLMEEIRRSYIDTDLTVPVKGKAVIRIGEAPMLTLRGGYKAEETVTVYADHFAEPAGRQPLTEEGVQDKLGRFGGTDFSLSSLDIDLEEGAFVPVRALNDLRRTAVEALRQKLLEAARSHKEIPSQ